MNKNQLTEEYIKKHFDKDNNLSKFVNESLDSNIDRSILGNQLYEAKDQALGDIVDYYLIESVRRSADGRMHNVGLLANVGAAAFNVAVGVVFVSPFNLALAGFSAAVSIFHHFNGKNKDKEFMASPHANDFIKVCNIVEKDISRIESDIKKSDVKLEKDSMVPASDQIYKSFKASTKIIEKLVKGLTDLITDASTIIEQKKYGKSPGITSECDSFLKLNSEITDIVNNNKKLLKSPELKGNSNYPKLNVLNTTLEKISNIITNDLNTIKDLSKKMSK